MDKSVSVVMAVYNGEKYLKEQVDSIIGQLSGNDELILSVDPSGDQSQKIALTYSLKDSRIHIFEGPGKGVVKNFENGLQHADGDYIFLSDQDDIWHKDKLRKCVACLEKSGVITVIHNCALIDSLGEVTCPSFRKKSFHTGSIHNIIKNSYIGCCMAFHKKLLDQALPFPKNIPMHDQWLGIISSKLGQVAYIDEPLLYYRRHSDTVTGRRRSGILDMIKWRWNIALSYIKWGVKRKNEQY
ncbi:MAG: glycosyltransferase family 2 protein [Christensenellales bacterium]